VLEYDWENDATESLQNFVEKGDFDWLPDKD